MGSDKCAMLPCRTNLRMLLMVLAVLAMACVNAMVVPLALEEQILIHPRSHMISEAARECGQEEACWSTKNIADVMGLAVNVTSRCASGSPHLQGYTISLVST